jgi:hypothetical protein
MITMMGSKERHFAPLINVSLEELVPQNHFYRHLERTLDLSFVRKFVQETYPMRLKGGGTSTDHNRSLHQGMDVAMVGKRSGSSKLEAERTAGGNNPTIPNTRIARGCM